jgi:hypothetical protein
MMRQEFGLSIVPSSLSRSSSGQIAGQMCVRICGTDFPDSKWSDSVVVILHDWLTRIESWIHSDFAQGSLRFMDGPYAIDVQRVGDMWEVSTCGSRHSAPELRQLVSPNFMVELVRAAAIAVLEEVATRGWNSEEIRR